MLIAYMEKGSEVTLEKKVDKREYSDEELISIKTKLNLPYYTSSRDFERSYGSININGVAYQYVKQRVYNDTLELLCLPNATKTKLQNVKNEITKTSADDQASAPVKKSPSTLKISLPDFFHPVQTFSSLSVSIDKAFTLSNEAFIPTDFTKRQERPPQAMEINS